MVGREAAVLVLRVRMGLADLRLQLAELLAVRAAAVTRGLVAQAD
jgi:hypothetical protein